MDLSRFPRRRYTGFATPIEPMPRFSAALAATCPGGQGPEVWIKRDDMLGLFPGGNKTRKLEFLVADALAQGADTLVLGCTHYPFVQALIANSAAKAGHGVTLVDTGEPVARQLQRLLMQHGLLRISSTPGQLSAYTTGSRTALSSAFRLLLGLEIEAQEVAAAVGNS